MAKKRITWTLEDHLCRNCGGRILMGASGVGATGGGNPLFKCADCGKASAAMGPDVLCWCGFEFRGQNEQAYTCLPFSVLTEHPEYLRAFHSSGCDPKSGKAEVGVVLKSMLKGL